LRDEATIESEKSSEILLMIYMLEMGTF